MSGNFNTEIKIFFEMQSDIQVKDALNDMHSVSRKVEDLIGRDKKWFFTGYSKKDALKNIVFDESGPTVNAVEIVNKHYKKTNH